MRAQHVDGNDPIGRRDRIMQAFKTGGIDVVGNCDLISEGFDAPACDAVLLGKRTKSVTRFLQMNRANRIDPANPNKVALVLDLAGSCHDLGLPDEPREWSLEDGEIQTRDDLRKKRRVRVCGVCSTVYKFAPCPTCGASPTLTEVEQVATELVAAKAAAERPKVSVKMSRKRARTLAIRADTDTQAATILAVFNKRHGYALNYGLSWVLQQRRNRRL